MLTARFLVVRGEIKGKGDGVPHPPDTQTCQEVAEPLDHEDGVPGPRQHEVKGAATLGAYVWGRRMGEHSKEEHGGIHIGPQGGTNMYHAPHV